MFNVHSQPKSATSGSFVICSNTHRNCLIRGIIMDFATKVLNKNVTWWRNGSEATINNFDLILDNCSRTSFT